MALKIHKFVRKPLFVDAVRINKENMGEVAQWCGGTLSEITVDEETVQIIKVRVPRPLSARQTQGYVGDWVLKSKNSFKIYTPKAFDKQFEKVRGVLTKKQADEAGIRPPIEEPKPKVINSGEVLSMSIVKDNHPAIVVEEARRKVTPAELEKLAKRHSKR